MRFFALEGSIPAVLSDDGNAFIWRASEGDWGEIKSSELLSDTRTVEETGAEFAATLESWGGSLSKLPVS